MKPYQRAKPIKRNKTYDLMALRELAIRIPITNTREKTFFTNMYKAAKAGYDGETKIDRVLENIAFPTLHTIIPDFHTQSKFGAYYQMDTVILTNRYILLLEIKNIRGLIEFHENPAHIIRTIEGVKEKMDCPIHQLARNSKTLENLVCNVTKKLPIYSAIVFCNPTAQVTSYPPTVKILYKNQVDFFIEKLNTLPEVCEKSEYQQVVKSLTTNNKNFKITPLSLRYSIDPSILRKGVFCLKCESPMHPLNRSTAFKCLECNSTYKDALVNSIVGLFGIFDRELSREQLENHLNIKAKDRIIKALTQLRCTKKGKARATRYSLPKT